MLADVSEAMKKHGERCGIDGTRLMNAVWKPRSGCYRQCRILDERPKELVDGTNFMLALLGRRFGMITEILQIKPTQMM